MITFKINGERYKLPTAWGDVSYRDYTALLSLPNSLLHYLNLFTGIGLETLHKVQIPNLEKIAIALAFINIKPEPESGASQIVGPYVLPQDTTIQSLGQFEDLKAQMVKIPREILKKISEDEPLTKEEALLMSDFYLTACAIYAQKLRDKEYNVTLVDSMKEELKAYSCVEVTRTGAFFLFRPLLISRNTSTHSQNIAQRLKKLIQDFPGYQKTLELMHRSLGSPEK